MKWQARLIALLVLAGITAPAGAQGPSKKYGDLLKRIPEQSNALLLVDVDGLMNSPLGQREKWRDRAANRPTGALGVSTDASKFVVAAAIDMDTAQERWKIGMLQTHNAPPPLTTLAAREGGYVEQLQTQNVAWTPRDFYLLSFPERIVGFATPAERQLLSGWIRNVLAKPRTFPPSWADRAINRADAGAQIVLAVNLEQAFAPKQIEGWLKNFQSENVKRNKINFDLLGQRLAGAKSAFLQVDVKETIQGTLRIDFEYPTDVLKPIAKELILAALEDYGVQIQDLKRWEYDARENYITMTGRLEEDSVRRMLSFISAPRLTPPQESYGDTPPPTAAEAPKPAPGQPAGEPSKDLGLKATQQYFRSVVDITQTLKAQKPDSKRAMKVWYDRSAKQIEDLPLLNVDNDLLDWGSKMARSIREMASGINYANKDTSYRINGTANSYYGGYGYTGMGRAGNAEVIRKQYNDVLSVELDGRWQVIETSIADTRRALVMKYKVDF